MTALFLTLATLTAPLHTLLVAVPGPHAFGHGLLAVLAGWLLLLAVLTQTAPEQPCVTSPDAPEGYPLSADLRTLNADLWAGLVDGPAEFYTLRALPLWSDKCAARWCETPVAGLPCQPCTDDCTCDACYDRWSEFVAA